MNAQPQDTFEIQAGARVTPSPPPRTANDRNRDKFYELAELFAEIQSSFMINAAFKKNFETMWAAMESAHKRFRVSKEHSDPSTYKYSVPHIFAAACLSMDAIQGENKAILFSSANGAIKAKRGTFQFIPEANGTQSDPQSGATPTVKKMTLEDAFNVLMLASFSDRAPRKLELEGGNEEERAIYCQAIKTFNNSVPSDMRFRLDEELEKLVQNAPSADQELAAYMDCIELDKSSPAANHGDAPESPTIIPDTEAQQQNEQTGEAGAPTKSPSESNPTQTPPAPATAIPTVSFSQATMNGKSLQTAEYQKLVDRSLFDPQLTLAKASIGRSALRAHPDQHLPMDLLAIYEIAAGKHGALVKPYKQTIQSALLLDELTLPELPKIKSISGSLTSYKFSLGL